MPASYLSIRFAELRWKTTSTTKTKMTDHTKVSVCEDGSTTITLAWTRSGKEGQWREYW